MIVHINVVSVYFKIYMMSKILYYCCKKANWVMRKLNLCMSDEKKNNGRLLQYISKKKKKMS